MANICYRCPACGERFPWLPASREAVRGFMDHRATCAGPVPATIPGGTVGAVATEPHAADLAGFHFPPLRGLEGVAVAEGAVHNPGGPIYYHPHRPDSGLAPGETEGDAPLPAGTARPGLPKSIRDARAYIMASFMENGIGGAVHAMARVRKELYGGAK